MSRGLGKGGLNTTASRTHSSLLSMADEMDVFAAMGISGFGKSIQKKELDPSRFDKNKRDEVRSLYQY